MSRGISAFSVFLFCCLLLGRGIAFGNQAAVKEDEGVKKITVEIDYGSTIRPVRVVEVPLVKGQTVLELLERVASVETHPVGDHVFVTAIDGVEGKRGETAWYYKVDGQSPKELAYSKVLGDEKTIKWIYKKDHCSWRVDGTPEPKEEGGAEGKQQGSEKTEK